VVSASVKNLKTSTELVNELNDKVSKIVAGDPAVVEATKELRQAEMARDDAMQEANNAQELRDLKENADQKLAGLAKKEKEQRSRMFNKGEEADGHGEVGE
jgi:hypothetical protein